MKKDRLLVPDVASQIGAPSVGSEWSGVDAVLPILAKMRADGAVIFFKLDGQRGPGDNGAYTAHVSGPPLDGDFVRVDADTVEDALAHVIVRYAEKRWGYTRPSR